MTVEFGFLEYSYNPDITAESEINKKFTSLGFTQYAKHKSLNTGLWSQGRSIIFVRSTDTVQDSGFSGIGFVMKSKFLSYHDIELDEELGFYVSYDPDGNRVLIITPENFNSSDYLANRFQSDEQAVLFNNESGIESIPGLLMSTNNQETIKYYESLGFKKTKNGDTYTTYITSDNRFSIVVSDTQERNGIYGAVFDTQDIFSLKAKLISQGIKFNGVDIGTDLNFGKLSSKIYGYKCLAFGNEDSYTIENIAENAVDNTDVIIRMRKQHLHISEETIGVHYGTMSYS